MLQAQKIIGDEPEAFADFPGLEKIFEEGQLALWRNERGEQVLWVPMWTPRSLIILLGFRLVVHQNLNNSFQRVSNWLNYLQCRL